MDQPTWDVQAQTPNSSPQTAPISNEAEFLIVGVGASAGGLEALEQLFDHMNPDSGMAFVIVQHLSPDFKSLMDELLSRHTAIEIHQAQHETEIQPNAIYLLPPKKEMIISGGRLCLKDKDATHGPALPIDVFFRSLASDAGNRAVGVVLSGTGSDGSRGIRDIHEAGGLTLVQAPESAKFDGMPRSAIDTQVIDAIIRPEEMPSLLAEWAAGSRTPDEKHGAAPLPNDRMQTIYRLLQTDYQVDFSHYKPSTVRRRIERRLQMNQILDLPQYVQHLESDRHELNALYKDLLIGVTRFFRDQEAFDRLAEDVLPPLLQRIPPQGDFRAWVVGTATGEEAYSLGMLVSECMRKMNKSVRVKIFASDVHRASLEYASAGIYPESSLTDVNPALLERYFTRTATGFQVSQELRQLVMFAPHNVMRDAPFTKLHLISCRNLLIYLQSAPQQKALSLFHFGLLPDGVLLLGPSESPGDMADEFEPVDKTWRIYRKQRDIRLPLSSGFAPRTLKGTSDRPSGSDHQLVRAYDMLLEQYVPPSLLISHRHELVHAFAGAGQYLTHPNGRPSPDVLEHVDRGLKVALAGALQRAATERSPVTYIGVLPSPTAGRQRVRITVRPLVKRASELPYFLVTFEDMAPRAEPTSAPETEVHVDSVADGHIQALEHELRYTQENLQATIEEMEASHEELQATNEELTASNEELQSTNEELHSVNQELYTVNAEHQQRIIELTELNDDMDHLLRSTEVGTIFLDSDLCIRKFTPKIAEQFRILPQDVGRRIDSFSHSIEYPTLIEDIHGVLRSRHRIEREVRDQRGHHFLLRILPYHSSDEVVGAVLTLIDIATLKATERKLLRMSKVFQDGADPIIIEDLVGRIIDLNHEAESAYGYRRDELLGRSSEVLVPEQLREHARQLHEECRRLDHVCNVEAVRCNAKGEERETLLTLSLLSDEQGRPTAIATISKDITQVKRAEKEARLAVKRRDQFLAMLSHELRNPLNAIRGSAHLVVRQDSTASIRRDAGHVIERQTKHMARLLDDLLDVSRITQGKIELKPEIVCLQHVVGESVRLVTPRLEQKSHQLHLRMPDIPVCVEGDPARLLQVVENLLTNAVKYTPPAGAITVTLEAADQQAMLRVADTGIGIAANMIDHIFDLFVQSDASLDRSEGGMGVGLTLIRSLVELHGGQVEARSEGSGRGSEFVIRFPRTQQNPTTVAAANEPPRTGELVEQKPRLLVVEDNDESRHMLRTLLELEGFQVWVAENGHEGLAAIHHRRPDVALIDVGMPGMDGFELARKIRALQDVGQKIRLIAVTGYGRQEDREAAEEAGFDDHYLKPINPAELRRLIDHPPPAG